MEIAIREGFNSFEEIVDGNREGIAIREGFNSYKCDQGGVQLTRIVIREGEQKEEFSETFAVLDKDQDTVITREGHTLNYNLYKDQGSAEKVNRFRTCLIVNISTFFDFSPSESI